MTDRIHELLGHWFGNVGSADLPTSDRTDLWFNSDSALKNELTAIFSDEYSQAISGSLEDWADTARGRLALIIFLDQFSRHLNQHNDQAFAYDTRAIALCLDGIEKGMDHQLTLIERVFFYMPLVHSEDAAHQEKSIRLYQELVSLSMSETTQIYQLFLAYAYAHFRVIKEYGRFPQRNKVLNRVSTEAELVFLKAPK